MMDSVNTGQEMLAVRVHGPGDLRIERIGRPEPGPGEALLRVLAVGVCATDRKLVDRGPPGSEPRVLGHEIVAEVVSAPADGPAVGSRVAIAPNLGCGNCPACAQGATNLCPAYRAFGIHLDGGMAEYLLAPRRALEGGHLLPIPEGLPTLEAILLEPLACCVEGLEASGLRLGERVLIVGAGVMGRLHVSAARALGAGTVIVSDLDRGRLEHALALGADVAVTSDEPLREAVAEATGGVGVDVAAVTIGVPAAAEAALASLARGGRLNLFAGFGSSAALSLDANDVHYRRLQVLGTSGATLPTLRHTLRALAGGRIATSGIVSSVRRLSEAARAFVEAGEGGHARVVLTPHGGSG